MLVHVYSDDDIELTTGKVGTAADMKRLCQQQAGIGDEDWTIRQWCPGTWKAVSDDGHILWLNEESTSTG